MVPQVHAAGGEAVGEHRLVRHRVCRFVCASRRRRAGVLVETDEELHAGP